MTGSAAPAFADVRQTYDLVILGSGIACTHTLQTLLGALPATNSGPVRIAVIENGGEFWRGYPYGRRSSPNSLIITNFKEFVPDEEHADFSAWLSEHRRSWTRRLAERGGETAARWLSDNQAAIEAGDWDALYIPRQLYGDFAEQRIRDAIALARSNGRAIVEEIAGEARAIERSHGGYAIDVSRDDGQTRVLARVVLLATGSPPFRMLPGAQACVASDPGAYINNAYLPSLAENLRSLTLRLDAEPVKEKRNLLVVGSNATSLELLYMIARDGRLREQLNKVVVLSNGGTLPHRMTGDRSKTYSFPRMQALASDGNVTPRQIMSAVQSDFDEAAKSATNIGDMFHQLSDEMVQLIEMLDPRAQREFHHVYGMQVTRIVRRAGAEYRDAAQDLLDRGKLELLAGRLEHLKPAAENAGVQFAYRADGAATSDPRSFVAAVNCAGFEDVSQQSSSGLLSSLLARKLAKVNPTGRGLEVDDSFAAGPDLYVCGPLLAGVFNDVVRLWHVENVRRIQSIAVRLGPIIASRVSERAQKAGRL